MAGLARSPWERLAAGERLAVRVGAPGPVLNNKCCKYGSHTPCEWPCNGTSLLNCPNDNSQVLGDCGDASCGSLSGENCSGTTPQQVKTSKCVRTGGNELCDNGYYRCIFDYFPPQNSNATVTKQFCKGSTPQSPESVCPDYSADAALDYFDACMATYGDPDYCGQFVSSIPWQPADPCTTGN